MARPIVHFEFWSQEPGRCGAFYADVFGWDVRAIPAMDYHLVEKAEGGIGGGIFTPKQGDWPAQMTLYIDVEDLAPYRDRIIAKGGKILVDHQEVPGVGAFCLFSDPDGRVMGCWKQSPGAKV